MPSLYYGPPAGLGGNPGDKVSKIAIRLIPGRLRFWRRSPARARRLVWVVERLNKADRAYTLAAVAAHDFNNDLTVILSSVQDTLSALDPGHPARPLLRDLQGAAERCAWTAAILLTFCARHGARPAPIAIGCLTEC